jgi:hypothetical protein
MKDRELIVKTAAAIYAANRDLEYHSAVKEAARLIQAVDVHLKGPTWHIGASDEE